MQEVGLEAPQSSFIGSDEIGKMECLSAKLVS